MPRSRDRTRAGVAARRRDLSEMRAADVEKLVNERMSSESFVRTERFYGLPRLAGCTVTTRAGRRSRGHRTGEDGRRGSLEMS